MDYLLTCDDCLDWLGERPGLSSREKLYHTIFADPPDNIGLKYGEHDDNVPPHIYAKMIHKWVDMFVSMADTVWFSFNARHILPVASAVQDILRIQDMEAKLCVQTFTFGQHNHHDLGNNFRPLWRLRRKNSPLFPDAVRIESERQKAGDKRADPRGRVPGDNFQFEQVTRKNLPIPEMSSSDIDRFYAKIDKAGGGDCWEWTAGKRDGYGRYRIGGRNGKVYGATRIMWLLTHGEDPGGFLLLHKCDNPGCCNPSHLFLGTDADNNKDKEGKARGRHPVGEENGLSKLTNGDVISIFKATETNVSLAKKYGVSDVAISCIRKGKTWKHVTDSLIANSPTIGESDVFNFPRVTGNSKQRRRWHPTQLHEGLVERCLRLTTPPGGNVCDPFGGTGTTMRVAQRCGFACDMIEYDQNYCENIALDCGLDKDYTFNIAPPQWIEGHKPAPERAASVLPLFGGPQDLEVKRP